LAHGGRPSTTSARRTWPTPSWNHAKADGGTNEVTWQINGQWQYDPDPSHASEIEVRFTADGPGQTVVELEHRLLDRLADGQAIHDTIISGGGWTAILELFAKAAANEG
jgi:hypothetical protein